MLMSDSSVGNTFLSSKPGLGDYPHYEHSRTDSFATLWRSNFSGKQPIFSQGQKSRKRMRTSLRMTQHREEENDDRPKKTENNRRPKLSFFDKLIDRVLVTDYSSSDSATAFLRTAILLSIFISSSLILRSFPSQILFIGLFLFLSLIARESLLLDVDEDNTANSFDRNINSLSICYFGALFLTCIMKPFDFEIIRVDSAADTSMTSIFSIPFATIGILSASGLTMQFLRSFFNDKDRKGSLDSDEDSASERSLSTEKRLMDIWDKQFDEVEDSKDHQDS